MNIESIANYADVIGGTAVIVSLIYVSIQIRRITKSSQSHTNGSRNVEVDELRELGTYLTAEQIQ